MTGNIGASGSLNISGLTILNNNTTCISPHTSGPKCTCSRNRLFVQNKKNDIFGICEIVKSIIIKISGDFNSTRNILKNPSCMCRDELRCQTPPLSKMSGSSCRCGVDWTRPKNAGLPKAFSRLSSPFRLSGWSSTQQATEKSERIFLQEAEILSASLVYLGVNSVIQAMLWFWLAPRNAAAYFGVAPPYVMKWKRSHKPLHLPCGGGIVSPVGAITTVVLASRTSVVARPKMAWIYRKSCSFSVLSNKGTGERVPSIGRKIGWVRRIGHVKNYRFASKKPSARAVFGCARPRHAVSSAQPRSRTSVLALHQPS